MNIHLVYPLVRPIAYSILFGWSYRISRILSEYLLGVSIGQPNSIQYCISSAVGLSGY
jgi:hypothetical protein